MKVGDVLQQSKEGAAVPYPNQIERALLQQVSNAAFTFMKALPECRGVRIIRLVELNGKQQLWEAEAELLFPNRALAALGLPLQREVLDSEVYLLRLDNQLQVVAYGPKYALSGSQADEE